MNIKRLRIIETWTKHFTMHKNVHGEWYGFIVYTALSMPQRTSCYELYDDAVDQAYNMVNEYIWNLTH